MELSVRNLVVTGRSGRVLLDVPRLDLKPGTALGVRGPSGAGKSTLLSALMGLAPRATGEVIWGATQLLRLGASSRAAFRRQTMGLVFQDFMLFDELGADANAAIQAAFSPRADRPRLRAAADRLLADLGLADPSRRTASYSGGERQRVAMARALAHDPRIVLADEPTASLDREAGTAIGDQLFARVRDRGVTLIVASHDEDLLDRMDRVLTLDHGKPASSYA